MDFINPIVSGQETLNQVKKMKTEDQIEAVTGILASMFASQRALRALAPEYKWAGLGNLLGDFGEFLAVHKYDLMKASAGSDGHDAKTKCGKTVQVKTNHAASQIGFRGEADLMLVLHIEIDGSWKEIYYGPFSHVKEASRHSARDNKQMLSLSRLKALNELHGLSKPTTVTD